MPLRSLRNMGSRHSSWWLARNLNTLRLSTPFTSLEAIVQIPHGHSQPGEKKAADTSGLRPQIAVERLVDYARLAR